MKEELRSMRLEAHTKQLTKELKSARAALEQERKLRKVQSDTIKVIINYCDNRYFGICLEPSPHLVMITLTFL